jgi:predicted secreted protein
MSALFKTLIVVSVLITSVAQANESASLHLVAYVPLRANVSVTQDPVTKKIVAVNNGSQSIKVQTVSRFPASTVTIIAP